VIFGVGPDRYKEGKRIEAEHPVNLFLLDDGFQHLELIRDVDIVLVDWRRSPSARLLLPAGSMREPLSALRRASAVVLTRVPSDSPGTTEMQLIQKFANVPTFCAETKLLGYRCVSGAEETPAAGEVVPPQPVFAFCGIGNPDAFFSDLQNWRVEVVGRKVFRDHHPYTAHDVKTLEENAEQRGAKALLTTEKDIQNLQELGFAKLPLYCCKIAIETRDGEALCALIRKKIASRPGAAG